MTDIEDQLHLYAQAITADRPLIPDRHTPLAAEPRRHRGAFTVAAALLVAVLIGGAVIALRSRPASTTSNVVTAGDVTTKLTLSTDTPDPDEVVTVELTITNGSQTELTLSASCSGLVAVTTDPRKDATIATGTSTFAAMVNSQMSYGYFSTDSVRPELTLDQLQGLVGPDAQQISEELTGCTGERQTLAAGATTTFSRSLEIGALGLPAGPGLVTTSFFGQTAPPNVSIPITLPEPPAGTLTRAQAVTNALAEPPVKETISSLPEPASGPTVTQPVTGSSPTTPTGSTNPTPDPYSSVFITWPIDDGWQIGYAQSSGQAFLVTYTSAGTHIDRAGTG
jgi:hypothetical protein